MKQPFERRLLLAAVAVWSLVAILYVIASRSLVHDEAAFGVAARGDGAWLYRSPGVIAIARLGLLLGDSEVSMRIVSIVIGATLPVAVWAIGSRACDARTGAWAAAVIAGTHPFAIHAGQLLGDIPATACVLAGMALLASELEREDGPRWRVAAVAPALAAAFYLRYASAPVIALIGLASAGLWWRSIARRPWPVVATVVLGIILLVPHLVQSVHDTGSALGILRVSAGVPRRAYVGEGLVSYVTTNPFVLFGALAGPLVILGVIAIARRPARWRPTVFLWLVAVGQMVALGIDSHAQPRYIYIATSLLVVLGVDQVRRLVAERQGLSRAGLALVTLAWLSVVVAIVPYARFRDRIEAPAVSAGRAIARDAGDKPCTIVAHVAPQLQWYSGCSVRVFYMLAKLKPLPLERARYAVSVPWAPLAIDDVAHALGATARPLVTSDPEGRAWALEGK